MAKKKQEEAPKGSPAWMATFSDLMNLLLCFFVLLFSMSTIDVEKYEMVVNSLQSAFSILSSGGSQITEGMMIGSGINQLPNMANAFGDTLNDTDGRQQEDGAVQTVVEGGGETTQTDTQGRDDQASIQDQRPDTEAQNPQDQQQQQQQQQQTSQQDTQQMSTSDASELLQQKGLAESEQMAENIEALSTEYGLQDIIEVDFNGQFVRLTINGSLLFASGSAELRPEAVGIVDNIAKILETYQNNLIEVEGHTDSIPISGSRYPTNEVLSLYRAVSVASEIRSASNLNPGNIMSSGRGEYSPIADNSTPEGRARNRRVEIKIYNSLNSEGL